jgi:phosphatidylinositol alpha-1,6-mannosyltransferase
VVLCGRWYPEGLLAFLAGRKLVAILVHGAELLAARVARLSWGQQAVRRRVLEAARVVIANSRYTAGLASSVAPRARVVALPLGADTTAFSPGDREAARARLGLGTRYVVSTVARVQSFKGHDTVIRALAGLPPPLRSNLTYYIAGQGSHSDALRRLAQELGVQHQVTFAGLVPEERLVEVYRASDLFCLMTRRSERAVEGFGLALLEAQSCGIPVLGSNVGGIPDAVEDGQTGFLLDPDDVAGVRIHLQQLLEEPQRYRKVGMAGRVRATNCCTWQAYTARMLEILRGNGAGGPR